ncbi:hypothetical protein C8Q78DRAFT_488276 [Trametes maxima]|nr:hypothetical protein C8Q78DRAFT_488276 [Trametes maxima]
MFFIVIVYVCAFAFAGVFQGIADDTLLPFLTSVLNIPTLSMFNNVFSLAGPAPRPTLSLPDLAISINSTDIYPFLPLSVNLDDLVPAYSFAYGSSVWYKFLGRSSGLLAIVLAASLLLVSWLIYTTTFAEIMSQHLLPSNKPTASCDLNDILYPNAQDPAQHIFLPTITSQTISMPVSADSPARDFVASDDVPAPLAPTPDIYDQLFGASSGDQVFEPITNPADMDQQLCDIIVNSTKGGAVVDCGEGYYPILAMFDSDEMHVGADWLEGYSEEEGGWNEDHG